MHEEIIPIRRVRAADAIVRYEGGTIDPFAKVSTIQSRDADIGCFEPSEDHALLSNNVDDVIHYIDVSMNDHS